MADITGPISSLPGTVRRPPTDTPCDNDCGRFAEVRVQGETDSFGSEMYDLCRPCWDQERQVDVNTDGPCDWCRKHADALRPARDPDEGSSGPVYYICAACHARHCRALERETRWYGDV